MPQLTTFQDASGALGQRLLYRADEAALSIESPTARWQFDADPAEFRLAAEALRIRMAGLHDPMVAVSSSAVEPLPHQIRAVYGELLPRTPLRFLLADDPGAGKTIMAGLYAKELMLRGDLTRMPDHRAGQSGRAVAGRAGHQVRHRRRALPRHLRDRLACPICSIANHFLRGDVSTVLGEAQLTDLGCLIWDRFCQVGGVKRRPQPSLGPPLR